VRLLRVEFIRKQAVPCFAQPRSRHTRASEKLIKARHGQPPRTNVGALSESYPFEATLAPRWGGGKLSRLRIPADKRQKNLLHDLPDDLVGKRLEPHQHLVAHKIRRQRDDTRREAVGIDLAALEQMTSL